ncbi:hypothetical protein ONZ45_g11024 [Pleurotus djamor]|nr:hypothetical protein ONZ45_g11024 [Pleurotus djamor]
MTSPDIKLEAEILSRSHWCHEDALRAWVSEQKAKGLACKLCATDPSPECQFHRPTYYRGKRAKRAYRKFIFTQKFGIDEATLKVWLREWSKKRRAERRDQKIQALHKSNSAVASSSSDPSLPTHERQKPAAPSSEPSLEAPMVSDLRQSDADTEVPDAIASDDESENDEDEDKDSQGVAPDSQVAVPKKIPSADAPSTKRDDPEPQSVVMDLDHPNQISLWSHKDAILTFAKSLVPGYKMETDDDTSDELLAIHRETGQSLTLVLQRKAVEAKAKAREAELMEEIRVLKEQVATHGSAQKALKTRLEAIVKDLPMEPVEKSDVAAPKATEVTRKKRKSSLHEDNDTRPSQRVRHTFLIPK